LKLLKKSSWLSRAGERLGGERRCSAGKEFLCTGRRVLQLGWELSPKATPELRDDIILPSSGTLHGRRTVLGRFPPTASPRAEPCSRLQPPAQGWGSRGSPLPCPYLLGSAGKSRKFLHYIPETCRHQAPTLPTSTQRLLKDKEKIKEKKERKSPLEQLGCWFIRAAAPPDPRWAVLDSPGPR